MGKTKEAGKKKRQRQIFTDRPARYAIRAVLRRAVTPLPLDSMALAGCNAALSSPTWHARQGPTPRAGVVPVERSAEARCMHLYCCCCCYGCDYPVAS